MISNCMFTHRAICIVGVKKRIKCIALYPCNMIVLLVGKEKAKSNQQNRKASHHNKEKDVKTFRDKC